MSGVVEFLILNCPTDPKYFPMDSFFNSTMSRNSQMSPTVYLMISSIPMVSYESFIVNLPELIFAFLTQHVFVVRSKDIVPKFTLLLSTNFIVFLSMIYSRIIRNGSTELIFCKFLLFGFLFDKKFPDFIVPSKNTLLVRGPPKAPHRKKTRPRVGQTPCPWANGNLWTWDLLGTLGSVLFGVVCW